MSMERALPEDVVLFNILPKLPWKSLLCFRCVCKSWDSFIRNPSFIHLRKLTTNNITHHLLFLSSKASLPHVCSTPFNPNIHINTTPPPPPRPSLLFTYPDLQFSLTGSQCVNGLLCFHERCNAPISSHVFPLTVIANPTTRQIVTLPIVHPTYKIFFTGTHFGHDPARDEFKVLRFVTYYDGPDEFKIFTVGVDTSWRVITAQTVITEAETLTKRGLCVNGAIYWRFSTTLLIFDVGTEQFRVMSAPSGYLHREGVDDELLVHSDLMEFDGCLCLVGYCPNGFKLWILRNCELQLWDQKSVVTSYLDFYPLCRCPNGEILLVPYFLGFFDGPVMGIYCDIDTMSSRSVEIMEIPRPLPFARTLREIEICYCQESFRLLK